MRYGIISDIHSNLEAFNAVFEALSKERIDKYICIGDIVGYGADPRTCVEKIRKLDVMAVLGNHDAGCTGFTDLSYFSINARAAVVWTKDALNESELEYLGTLKLVIENNDFTIVHGTLDYPAAFHYMIDVHQAMRSFNILKTKILFVGHSHIPGIFEQKNNRIKYFYREHTRLSENAQYIVNGGSVGQPRDGDNRASYVVYDSRNEEIHMKRIKYSITKAQEKILKAGLPPMLAYRLSNGI